MTIAWITPVDVTPGSADAWTDVDVSSHIPSGATGVMLHVEYASATNEELGLRKNGSTDNRIELFLGSSHAWAAIGVDGSRIFEAYFGDVATNNLWLVGYFESEAVFNTNAVSKTLGTVNTWVDVDISGDTGGDTAIGAIFEFEANTNVLNIGIRKNGSTDNRVEDVSRHTWAITGVDGSEICEINRSSTSWTAFLTGYIKSGATFNTNATDLSLGTTGSWIDLSSLPSGATGGFIEVFATTRRNYGLRVDGSSEEIYLDAARNHAWAFVKAASQVIEGKIQDVRTDFFLVGYAEAGSGVAAAAATGTGTGTGTGVGSSVAAATAASTGIGTASAVGTTASTEAVASATGTGAATGVGVSTAAATAGASGTGAATGVVASANASTAAAQGDGIATAVGTSIVAATASVAGVGAATASGAAIYASVAAASGQGAASAAGASTAAGVGAASGIGAGMVVGASTAAGAALASGAGTAEAVGAISSAIEAIAAAAGTGSALGTGLATAAGIAVAGGASLADAVGARIAAAVAAAAGVGAAAAVLRAVDLAGWELQPDGSATWAGAGVAPGSWTAPDAATATWAKQEVDVGALWDDGPTDWDDGQTVWDSDGWTERSAASTTWVRA